MSSKAMEYISLSRKCNVADLNKLLTELVKDKCVDIKITPTDDVYWNVSWKEKYV